MRRMWMLLLLLSGAAVAASASTKSDDNDDISARLKILESQIAELKSKEVQWRPNIFNPSITVFGNLFGESTIRPPIQQLGSTTTKSSFAFREFEFDFRATIDPYADGVVIMSAEFDGKDFGVDIEEGYFLLKQIPFDIPTPDGLRVKVGKFRTAFGRMNKIHLHDLPQSTYPLPITDFFGPHGMAATGISIDMPNPTTPDDHALGLTVEVLGSVVPHEHSDHSGHDHAHGERHGDRNSLWNGYEGALPNMVTRGFWFWDIDASSNLELGASAYLGASGHEAQNLLKIYGADATYKWKPLANSHNRSFLVGGEVFVANNGGYTSSPWPVGSYIWSQVQVQHDTYVGARYCNEFGLKTDEPQKHHIGGFLTYYTSEFLRFRVGYEYAANLVSGLSAWGGSHRMMLELNFVMGSHPAEPYWVNM